MFGFIDSLILTLIKIISVPCLIIGGVLFQMYSIRTVLVILAVNVLVGSGLCVCGVSLRVNPIPDPQTIHKSDGILAVSTKHY